MIRAALFRSRLAFSALFAAVAMLAPVAARAGNFRVFHSFAGGAAGGFPLAGVVRDKAGNLYGTTAYGGSTDFGTVFRLTPKGSEAVLHSFAGGADGENPVGGLTIDRDGNIYGATEKGGTDGTGTVFELTPDGTETVLHAFSNGDDGGAPTGGLMIWRGSLYGTTGSGGAHGGGVLFRLTTTGKETVLHSFAGGNDGYEPLAGVVFDKAGNLYGTTLTGGANMDGTVYEVSSGGTESVLHTFAGNGDGAAPAGALIFDSAGNLYGTTETGGTSDAGTVFSLAQGGTETILYSFTGGSDGANPSCALVRDARGNLYGTAPEGETDGDGDLFELAPSGTLTVLHSFQGRDGANPVGGLIPGAHGDLYGTAPNGGKHGYGVVFELRN